MRTRLVKCAAAALALTMLVCMLLVVPSGSNALASGWTATKVYDHPGSSYGANENSIAVDSHGHVHIAFANNSQSNDGNTVLYATNASGSWVTEVIEPLPDVGYFISLALDSNDRAHISYYSYDHKSVKYATNAGGTWTTETVIGRYDPDDGLYTGDGEHGTSVAVDSSGTPHIVYTNQTNPEGSYAGRHHEITMAVKVGGSWAFEVIDSITGGGAYLNKALVIDPSDHCHVAYSLGSRLHYATNMGGSWATQQLDDEYENGWGDSIALDRQGHVGISYITNHTTPPLQLKYATNASGSWLTEYVASSVGRPALLGYDPSGNPCITAFSSSRVALYSMTSGVWVKSNPIGTSTYISLHMDMMADSRGKLHMSYVEYGDLYYATNSIPVDVYAPTITITSPSDTGSYSTMSNTVAISGTASDDVGVTSVSWANDRGGSGTATGTVSWAVGSVVLQPGDNVITVTAHDAAGRSTPASITVTYTPDTTDPTVTISSPSADETYDTNSDHIPAGELAGIAWDDIGVTSVTCHNNANDVDVVVTGTTAWSTTTDLPLVIGENVIVITALDAAGNSGTDTITVTHYVDTTDPTVSITSPTEGSATSSTAVTVTWTGSDNVGVTGFQYRIDDGDWSAASLDHSHTFSGLSQGPHTVDVRAIDGRSNIATASVTFIVDLEAPTLSTTAPAGGALVNTPTVSWTGNDALSGIDYYQVRVDSGSWSGHLHTLTYTFPNLADGPHQAYIRAYDRAGNYMDRSVNFILDTTPPALIIDDPSPGFVTKTTTVAVQWEAEDSIAGLAGFQYRIDGGPWSPLTTSTSQEFADLSDGSHNVTIRSIDQLGNTGEKYIVFTVDTVSPVLTINAPANGTYYNTATVTVDCSASDLHSGVLGYRYRLDGGAWSTVSMAAVHSFTGLAEGAHTLEVEAIDKANNSASATVAIVVDVSSPVMTITVPTDDATYVTNSSSLAVSGTGWDNLEVLEVTWVNSRGGSGAATLSGTSWSIPLIALQEGDNILTITARDAGNNTAVSTLTVTYAPDSLTQPTSQGLDAGTISLILVVIVVAIVAAAFLVWRRKK